MIRRACKGDEAALDAFLAQHAETSMFLRSDMAAHGLEERKEPRGIEVYITEKKGKVTGAFGRSNQGYLMAQGNVQDPEFMEMLRSISVEWHVAGMNGRPEIVALVKAALGLENAEFSLDEAEDLYRLDLSRLTALPAEIRPPTPKDLPLLCAWVYDYETSIMGALKTAATRTRVAKAARQFLADGRTRLLIEDGKPVAKTAFNAHLPDMVQIGGVYTPPALRNRGYARRVVAAHLAEARAQGVKTAILFTSGLAAARAYRAIGFERIGLYTLATLRTPTCIGAAT